MLLLTVPDFLAVLLVLCLLRNDTDKEPEINRLEPIAGKKIQTKMEEMETDSRMAME